MDVALLITAFGFGFAARIVGLPPLVGYLVAGFVLHGFGFETTEAIDTISDFGVLLLLFGIGLKLKLRTLARPEVWATATIFAVSATVLVGGLLLALGTLGLPLVRDLDFGSAAIVGFALSFSSTVFAVKALERTNESSSLAGRLAIGVLILQDIFAVGFLVATGDGWPSPWALALIPAIFLLRPVFGWLLNRSDHGEILILFGFTLAIGIGAGAFDAVGLKPDLGALIAGLMLSRHPRAGEMSDRLLAFKDLFLIGFFLSIGLDGTPPTAAWVIGAALLLLVPARIGGFLWLFTRFRLRARTSLHASLTLSTYSEFGLIVGSAALAADLLDQAWVSTVAVAVAGSFVLASWANASRYRLYEGWSERLTRLERHPQLPEDAVVDCGMARVLIFGMGRIGTGAYDELAGRRGSVVGVDRQEDIVGQHRQKGRSVIRGDALDRDFWERVKFHPEVELVVAAMSSHRANLECVRRIRQYLPGARIAAIASYPDQVAELTDAGVDVARNLYEEAGQALADDAVTVVWDSDR
jgi:glutathione-regulated potassium-efflux system ancillary protein KefC